MHLFSIFYLFSLISAQVESKIFSIIYFTLLVLKSDLYTFGNTAVATLVLILTFRI